jgi:transcription initiation factor TFIIIB Brf1 subunit/transcription initiation factor TFIIB
MMNDDDENCPECGSRDYVELSDESTGTSELVCLECGFFLRWRIEERRLAWGEIISRLVSTAKGK